MSRLAIVSSPRSGNSFIRFILADALGWPTRAIHSVTEAPDELPKNFILQIHWEHEPAFVHWLTEREFSVLTIARHPLDTLLSAIRFSYHNSSVARWLDGRARMPVRLGEAGTASDEFLAYCLSDGAAALLAISAGWWSPASLGLRYEDVVADPIGELRPIIERLGGSEDKLKEAIAKYSLEGMRELHGQHGWRADPGHWKHLVPTVAAVRIYLRHRSVFKTLSYGMPVSCTTAASAARNWKAVF
jgi:hypothetical protein